MRIALAFLLMVVGLAVGALAWPCLMLGRVLFVAGERCFVRARLLLPTKAGVHPSVGMVGMPLVAVPVERRKRSEARVH
jgi:hypothetical protein